MTFVQALDIVFLIMAIASWIGAAERKREYQELISELKVMSVATQSRADSIDAVTKKLLLLLENMTAGLRRAEDEWRTQWNLTKSE